MADHLVLVGMMGAGKSTVGRLVSRRLDRRFVDVDEEVERSTGTTVAVLFAERGERAFRALEEQALGRCLETDVDTVVSAGGGAVLSEMNRARLSAATVVWLRARPETLAARVGDASTRPLLAGAAAAVEGTAADLDGRMAELQAERAPLYEAVADVVIDVDDLSAEAVAERVVQGCR